MNMMVHALEAPRIIEAYGGTVYPPLSFGWPRLSEVTRLSLDDLELAYKTHVLPRVERIKQLDAERARVERAAIDQYKRDGKRR